MIQTKNILNIAGKKIDTCNYLQTLQPDNNNFSTKINITDYTDLGNTISAIIGVCQTTLILFSDNPEFSESEKEKLLGSSSLEVQKVLELAKSLIPYAEFELLDKIQLESQNVTNEND